MGIFCRPKRLLVAGLVTSLSPEPRFEVIQSVILAGRRPVADHNESLPHESQRSRICYSALGLGLLLYVWPAIYMVGSGWFVRSGFAVTGIEVPDEGFIGQPIPLESDFLFDFRPRVHTRRQPAFCIDGIEVEKP